MMKKETRRTLHFVVLVTLLFQMEFSLARDLDHIKDHADAVCARQHLPVYEPIKRNETTIGDRCCMCPKGTYVAKDCKFGEPNTTECKDCLFDENNPDDQTFTTQPNNLTQCMVAHGMTYCDKFQNTIRIPGSRNNNSICICKDGYRTTGLIEYGGCFAYGSCEKGFQPSRIGTNGIDTQCEPCPNGTFSNVSSSTAMCMKFSLCPPGTINMSEGTKERDVKCYYMTSTSSDIEANTKLTTSISQTTMRQPVEPHDDFSKNKDCQQTPPNGCIAWLIVVSILLAIVIGISFSCYIYQIKVKKGEKNIKAAKAGGNNNSDQRYDENHEQQHDVQGEAAEEAIGNGENHEQERVQGPVNPSNGGSTSSHIAVPDNSHELQVLSNDCDRDDNQTSPIETTPFLDNESCKQRTDSSRATTSL